MIRWKSPKEAKTWAPDVYNATSIAPACPQKYCRKYLPSASCPNIVSVIYYMEVNTAIPHATNLQQTTLKHQDKIWKILN